MLMKKEVTKTDIDTKKFNEALGRITESTDYWAIKQLIENAKEKLNGVLTINSTDQSVEKIAAQLLSHQKAIAIIREMIERPFEKVRDKGEPKKYNFV